jgi:hypothetical protein
MMSPCCMSWCFQTQCQVGTQPLIHPLTAAQQTVAQVHSHLYTL